MRLSFETRVRRTFRIALLCALAALILAVAHSPAPLRAGEADEEAPRKVIKMTVENFKWVPDEIRVRKGTHVVLQIRSYDATHRFDLKKHYGLKVLLPQGEVTEVSFVADEAGTFRWKCGRPCGDGCPKLRGKLVVYESGPAAADSKE